MKIPYYISLKEKIIGVIFKVKSVIDLVLVILVIVSSAVLGILEGVTPVVVANKNVCNVKFIILLCYAQANNLHL